MTQVNDGFDGREVILHTGEMLEVRLSENPSTGYRWKEPEESRAAWVDVLRQVDDKFESAAPPTPGKPGTRILHFEAVAAGDADLVLLYGRSWDSGAQPAKTFRLRVRVQPGH